MPIRTRAAAAFAAAIALFAAADQAAAATLFKGTGIVAAVAGTNPLCAEVFEVGDDFQMVYRPYGLSFLSLPESLLIQNSDGAMIITNLDTVDRTLKTGTVSIAATLFGATRSVPTQAQAVTISPFPVLATSPLVTLTARVVNAGMTNCTVTVAGRLLPVNSPF